MKMHRIGDFVKDLRSLKSLLVENFPSPLIITHAGSVDSFHHEKIDRHHVTFKMDDELLFNEFVVEKYLWKTNFGIVISQGDRDINRGDGSVIIITLLILFPEVFKLSNSICSVEFVNHRRYGFFQKISIGNPKGEIFDYNTSSEAIELITALNQFMDLISVVSEKK